MARKFAEDFADARTGWDFLYGVMTVRVPASAAVSTSRDGLGCLTEVEVVVLGREGRGHAESTAWRGTNEAGGTYGEWGLTSPGRPAREGRTQGLVSPPSQSTALLRQLPSRLSPRCRPGLQHGGAVPWSTTTRPQLGGG